MTVRAALETALNAMSPALSTAWENAPFNPVAGTAYQKAFVLLAEPENPDFAGGLRERGIFQITLMYPLGAGPKAAEDRAAALRAIFKPGVTFTAGGVTVIIEKTPAIGPGTVDGDRWALPVKIRFFSNQF